MNYIGATIESVINQSYLDFECLVIDDGSTDGSDLIVKACNDKRIKYLRQENSGVSSARNLGIRLAKGDFIAFLDADDKWSENYLETIVGLIHQFPNEVFFCAASSILCDKETVSVVRDYCRYNYICFTSAIVVRRDVFCEIPLPPFRVGVNLGEDRDLWLRISCKHPLVYFNTALVEHPTNTGDNLSKKTDVCESFPYWEWYDYDYPNPKSLYHYATYMIVECCAHLVYAKRYQEAMMFLKRCKGLSLLKNRIALACMIMFKR